MKIMVDVSDYTLVLNESELTNYYPLPRLGKNRPVIHVMPDRYPCLFKEVAEFIQQDDYDLAILTYIYDIDLTNDNLISTLPGELK